MNVSLNPARMEGPASISLTPTNAPVLEGHKVHICKLKSNTVQICKGLTGVIDIFSKTMHLSAGVHCEINLDDCNPPSDPLTNEPKCFNNGKCVDRIGGYQCLCPPGYVGERCEGDVNECLSNPCDPRGSYNCIQLPNSYRCECRTGYTGMDEDRFLCPWKLIV